MSRYLTSHKKRARSIAIARRYSTNIPDIKYTISEISVSVVSFVTINPIKKGMAMKNILFKKIKDAATPMSLLKGA